ncbi:MAG: YHYH protein [Bacteroidota bacterium]
MDKKGKDTQVIEIVKMKPLGRSFILLLSIGLIFSACGGDEVEPEEPDEPGISTEPETPTAAFDEFNADAVTISFDGDEITIESNGLPNHTSPYWEETNPLYIDAVVALALTPGRIGGDRSFTLTVPAAPELAASSTATGLGPIGISVTGVPIFNDTEGPNRPLEEQIVQTFDYAGAHNGPSGYHYHIESYDVPENTELSHDDGKLVGIMADGFLLYGRREMDGSYPTDLDESGGHYGETPHSNGVKIYHYHIVNEYYLGNIIALFAGDLQGTPNAIL